MCLAALVDAGVPLDYLQAQLARLGINDEFTLSVVPVLRQGLRALQAQVVVKAAPEHSPNHHDHDPVTASTTTAMLYTPAATCPRSRR